MGCFGPLYLARPLLRTAPILPGRPPPAYDERGPAPILARPFRTAVPRSEVLDRHLTMVEFTRCKRHPDHRVSGPDSDDVPKKRTNKSTRLAPLPGRPPPADERGPAPASSPSPSDLSTGAWCFSTTRAAQNPPTASPVGNDRGLRGVHGSPTARTPVSEGSPAVFTDDRDFVIELTSHFRNLNCTPYRILVCSLVT